MGERPRSHHRKLAEPKQRRAANADRDKWVALDFHTRVGRYRAREVGKAWGLDAPLVDLIAHRYRRRLAKVLEENTVGRLRTLVEMHHARLLPTLVRARYKRLRPST